MIGTGEGRVVIEGGFGVVLQVPGEATGGAYSVVEHPLSPGVLAAPPHAHRNEDEVSYVVEGRVGAWLDGEESVAEAGDYIIKPRGVPHTFWNAGEGPARVVEIISPAGFEAYFEELAGLISGDGEPDFGAIARLAGRYGLTFQPERMGEILERHGVRLPG